MTFHPRETSSDHELLLFTRKMAIAVAFAVALVLLWAVRDVMILIAIAAVLAAGIAPAVHRVRVLERRFPRRNVPRGTAVLMVYFPFLFLAIVLLVVMVPRLVNDSRELSALASFVAVLFMVVYTLIDAHRLRNMIPLFYPPDVRAERQWTLHRMARRMSSWLAAQLILSAMMGAAIFILLLALRLPYALPLALFAPLGEKVPVGAALLGVVGVIIAIPAAAIQQVAFEEVFVARRERRQNLDRAGTLLKRRD